MPPLSSSISLLVCFFFIILSYSAADNHRRILHQPLFPIDSQPPSQPHNPPPPAPPPAPKYPFTGNTPPAPGTPFFPTIPTPPPPPPPSPASLASFPVNISSLTLPQSSKSKPASSKLIAAAIAAVIAAAIVVGIVVFLHIRKRRRSRSSSSDTKTQRSDNSSLHPNPSVNRNIPKLQRPSQTSSEFLYLGTLVNSHGHLDNAQQNAAADSSSRKLDSPELRPLPPLSGQQNYHSGPQRRNQSSSGADEEYEEFYSPRESSIGTRSASRRAFTGVQVEKFTGLSSSSAYSYSCSSSASGSPVRSVSLSISPPASLSPKNSRPKSPKLVAVQAVPLRAPPPPPPPPPPLSSKNWDNSLRTHTPVVRKIALEPPIQLESPTLISPIQLPSKREAVEKEEETIEETPKPKLKPLHWDKVRASSDREMVWDQLKSSSFKLNEEMIETLFIVNTPNPTPKEATRRQVLPSPNQENRVLDPKKSQNIAILLRALNVTVDEVCEALLEGNVDNLGTELLESLLKMAPTKEEERKLKEFKDDSPVKLGTAEKFLKAVLDIPFAFKRLEAMLYVSNFDSEVEYLKKSFETLEAACEELRNSRMFLKLLEAVLKTGNRMNVGTNRGDAHAFKLDTLLKLVDVKGADGKTTLLHFVVQEIIRSEGARLAIANQHQNSAMSDDAKCRKLGLQVVSSISSELTNVKKSAAMDAEVLNSDVLKLSKGLGGIAEVVRLIEAGSDNSSKQKFSESVNGFMKLAEEEIIRIQAQESVALTLVKEITEYFHGNSAKEEAHPFRIFMVVRDFLTILDRVCKEVGLINERTTVSSAHRFPVPVNPMLQPVSSCGLPGRKPFSSSDEESSSP